MRAAGGGDPLGREGVYGARRFCPVIGCGKLVQGGGWECFDCDRVFCSRDCHKLYIAGDWVPGGVLAEYSGDEYGSDLITSGPGACCRCGDPLPCGADGGYCDDCADLMARQGREP